MYQINILQSRLQTKLRHPANRCPGWPLLKVYYYFSPWGQAFPCSVPIERFNSWVSVPEITIISVVASSLLTATRMFQEFGGWWIFHFWCMFFWFDLNSIIRATFFVLVSFGFLFELPKGNKELQKLLKGRTNCSSGLPSVSPSGIPSREIIWGSALLETMEGFFSRPRMTKFTP